MRRVLDILVGAAAVLLMADAATAQDCKPDDVYAVIDKTGQRLRDLNGEAQPRIAARLRELGRKNGWRDDEAETRGRAAVEDDDIRNLDGRAAELLADLDRIGDIERSGPSVCDRVEQARVKSAQLVEVSSQRNAHFIARIELELRQSATAGAQPSAVPPPVPQAPAVAPAPAPVQTKPQHQSTAAIDAPPRAPPPAQTARPKQAPPASWDARTSRETEALPPPPPLPPPYVEAMPLPPDPGPQGFSPEEIRAAGRGFFGTISAGLASVIDHAFQKLGRPTGYILGDEGGGAFFAGLRYGEGRLVTKLQGEQRVFWQGPSAGFDFGLAGSRVMFLVYSIDDHEELFQRFTGVDGSAYLVGGVGVTFLKRGKVILAPIRTGLGLRVGANIGYLKFTPRPSINPF